MPSKTATTPDGLSLSVHDLGGDGPPALLVHATGFHGRVFGPLARGLRHRLHCVAPDLRGQGSSGVPPELDFDWIGFGTDVLTAVDALGLEAPVGIGHSCGGAALLLAEQARPGTFSSLYCYEPIVFPTDEPPPRDLYEPLAARANSDARSSPLARRLTPTTPPSLPWRASTPRCSAAYVEFGFEDLPDGTVRLLCRGENEACIYENGFGHPAFSRLGAVECPVVVAGGAESYSFSPSFLELLVDRLANGRLDVIEGLGHFGPLELPGVVAEAVIRAVDPPPA